MEGADVWQLDGKNELFILFTTANNAAASMLSFPPRWKKDYNLGLKIRSCETTAASFLHNSDHGGRILGLGGGGGTGGCKE